MNQRPRSITLHIDHIQVTGIGVSRDALAGAIQRELQQLLGAPGFADGLADRSTARVVAGEISPSASDGQALGHAVAHATIAAVRP